MHITNDVTCIFDTLELLDTLAKKVKCVKDTNIRSDTREDSQPLINLRLQDIMILVTTQPSPSTQVAQLSSR